MCAVSLLPNSHLNPYRCTPIGMKEVIQSTVRGSGSRPPHLNRRTFHYFPTEVVRMIFEAAARWRATACALCLVSKRVNAWITPFLYETVVIVDSRAKHNWNSFYRTMTLTRNACSQTRSLMLKQVAILPNFNFKDFSRIRNLVVHVLELPDVQTSHPPNSPYLTHLTLNGIPYSGVFSLPLFRSITHLHLPHALPHRGCQLTPENLPSLTHIVGGYHNMNINDQIAWERLQELVPILEKFRRLRLVAVYLIRNDGFPDPEVDVPSLLDQIRNITNLPILIRNARLFSICDSEAWINGGESIWDRAERELYFTSLVPTQRQNAF